MIGAAPATFTNRAADWPKERIAALERDEIEQLRANALALGEQQVVELCDAVLATCTKRRRAAPGNRVKGRRLISRSAAFEARGVYLQNARTSWGGVRSSDGTVVLGLWADGVQSGGGSCRYMLWAPNVGGSHPWSDTAAGKERLKHCELVVAGAQAEGLLVFGDRMEGHAPEEKARSVHGVDPQTVVRLRIEKRGTQFWAVWGKRTNGD